MTLQADEVVINSTMVAWHGPKMLQVFTSLPFEEGFDIALLAGGSGPKRNWGRSTRIDSYERDCGL
jgi:hypothetical protein